MNNVCQGCNGDRHEPTEVKRYSTISRQWLCAACWLDEQAWAEDMDEPAPVQASAGASKPLGCGTCDPLASLTP